MKLPTILGKQLLQDMFKARMADPSDSQYAVAAFQRMALVTEFDAAVNATVQWFKPEHRMLSNSERARLLAAYATVKHDVLGHAVDSVMSIIDSTHAVAKDRLEAAKVINDLFGEKQLITDERLTDRLVVNLVSNNES